MAIAKSNDRSRKLTAIRSPYTKSQLCASLAESTGLSKKNVIAVLDELTVLIGRHIKKQSAGHFTLPGLLKIKTQKKPPTKARKMMSPFTGEEITVKAKPASTSVKVQALKGLKEMVG